MFVAIVGPSGAGKDTLIRAVAEAVSDRPEIIFVRRIITRLSDGVTEDHDTMTPEAFEAGRAAGTFCLSWGAHGLFYGFRNRHLMQSIEATQSLPMYPVLLFPRQCELSAGLLSSRSRLIRRY